jgi:biotin transport system permease protein
MLPLYIHRTSPIHQLPPGLKLAASLIAGSAIFFAAELWQITLVLALVCGLYWLAELPAPTIVKALRPVIIVCVLIFAVQLLLSGTEEAARVVMRLMALVLLTSLVTLTTRFSDMLDVLTRTARPLAFLGLSPPKLALATGLVIRFIPTLLHDLSEIRQARLARQASGWRSFGPGPLIVKILRMTDALAGAIAARGFENRK